MKDKRLQYRAALRAARIAHERTQEERLHNVASLLLELGRDGNNPTEVELVMGCRDGARALKEALDALRRMRKVVDDHDALTSRDGDSR